MVRCHVKGCGKSAVKDKNHNFFRQPKNLELRKKWREFAQVPGSPTDLRICSDHFEPRCIRKIFPRPLLVPESIPTILQGLDKASQNNANGVNSEQRVIFERSTLQDECSHKDNSIVMDITKATGEDPTIIEIQRNNKIRIVIRDDETETTTQNQSPLTDDVTTPNNSVRIPTSIQQLDKFESPITNMNADIVDHNSSSSIGLCKSPPHQITGTHWYKNQLVAHQNHSVQISPHLRTE